MRVAVPGRHQGHGPRAGPPAWRRAATRLFLLGRDAADLERSARDLEVRGGGGTRRAPPSATSSGRRRSRPPSTPPKPRSAASTRWWSPPASSPPRTRWRPTPSWPAACCTVDFTNTVVFCEEARRRLLARGGGTLCVFSSVAGERGRKPVVLYGAAKAGLTRYLEGLDHKFRAAGPADGLREARASCSTSMTDGLPAPPFAGEPEAVAAPRPARHRPRARRWSTPRRSGAGSCS